MLLPSSVSFFIIIFPRKTRNFFPLKIFIVWIRQSSFKIILLPTKSNILRTYVCSYSHVPIVVASIFPLFYYYWNLRPSSKFTYSSLAPTYLNERPGWGSEANWVCGTAIGLLSQLGQITKPPPCLLICELGLTIVSSISRVLRDLLMKDWWKHCARARYRCFKNLFIQLTWNCSSDMPAHPDNPFI